jgi:hypothetical protein
MTTSATDLIAEAQQAMRNPGGADAIPLRERAIELEPSRGDACLALATSTTSEGGGVESSRCGWGGPISSRTTPTRASGSAGFGGSWVVPATQCERAFGPLVVELRRLRLGEHVAAERAWAIGQS